MTQEELTKLIEDSYSKGCLHGMAAMQDLVLKCLEQCGKAFQNESQAHVAALSMTLARLMSDFILNVMNDGLKETINQ